MQFEGVYLWGAFLKLITFNSIPFFPNSCLQVQAFSFSYVDIIDKISQVFVSFLEPLWCQRELRSHKAKSVVLKNFLGSIAPKPPSLTIHLLTAKCDYVHLASKLSFYISIKFYPPPPFW